LRWVERLSELRELAFRCEVTDAGVAHLKGLVHLRRFGPLPKMTDRGMPYLAGMGTCKRGRESFS